MRAALRARLSQGRGEDGFLLVEVLVSAVLVAMIVVATFNGLDVAHRISADQRRHDQAAILAAQSQEQLRSEPASALNALVSSPHKYTKTVGGTNYTVTQEAKNVGASGKTTGCSVTETKAQTGTNFQINSTVSWKNQELAKRPPVKATGVVTPPTGSAVEVDVINGLNEGVAGVTAKATFIPFESGSYNTVEGTTGPAGCVVLTGIQATSATIEIVEKTGYVTPSGALKVPTKELAIAPNITTHYAVQYAQAGRIAAHFTYEGKEVPSDTFVAANTAIPIEPKYETGSTAFSYEKTGEEKFLPLPGKSLECSLPGSITNLYCATSWTAAGSKYPIGDLFPFKEKWTVYAGDCAANNTGPEAVAETVQVKSGETANVKVPTSYTKLSIWNGKSLKEHGEPTSKRYGPVKITNTECESAAKPPNATGTVFTHEQKETLPEGRLEVPYQPFGKNLKLCVVNSEAKKTYTVSFTNTTAAGSTPNIYLGQRPNAEISAERAAAEAEMKANEAYKEKGGYSGKEAEAKKEKEEYEKWLGTYNSDKGKYAAEKINAENLEGKYTAEKTNYTNLLSKYNTEKTKYTTKKTAYENKKAEYEKAAPAGKKASQKTEYEQFKSEYEAAKTAYEKYETEYKAAETAYKKYETEYKAAETAYKNFKTAYEKDKTEYEKYKAAYELDEAQAAEYRGYLKYVSAKAAYEKLKAEEEDAISSGVIVKAGTTC